MSVAQRWRAQVEKHTLLGHDTFVAGDLNPLANESVMARYSAGTAELDTSVE